MANTRTKPERATAAEIEEALELVGDAHVAHLESVAGAFAAAGLDIVTPEKQRASRARLVGQVRERLSSASAERVAATRSKAQRLLEAARLLRWPVRDAMLDMTPPSADSGDSEEPEAFDETDEDGPEAGFSEAAREYLCNAEALAASRARQDWGEKHDMFKVHIVVPEARGEDTEPGQCRKVFEAEVMGRNGLLERFANELAELCQRLDCGGPHIGEPARIEDPARQAAYEAGYRIGALFPELARSLPEKREPAPQPAPPTEPKPEPDDEEDEEDFEEALAGIAPEARKHLFDNAGQKIAEDKERSDWASEHDLAEVEISIPGRDNVNRWDAEYVYSRDFVAPRGSLARLINEVNAAVARAARGGVTTAAQESSDDE